MFLIPHPSKKTLGTLCSPLLLAGLFGWASVAQAQGHPPVPEPHRIQVQAQSELSIAPDKATLNARLWERTPTIAQRDNTEADPEALAESRQRLETRTGELIRRLEEAGIDSQSINAGSLTVRPDYIQRPSREDDPGDMLVRTQLERPISLHIENLERLPTILDALTEAGVNALDGVTYDLKDRDAATDRALTQALEKARHKAQLMADTLGVELGRVISVQETNAPVFAPRMMAMRADGMEGKAAPEYRPGEITIDAGVTVGWEIAPQ